MRSTTQFVQWILAIAFILSGGVIAFLLMAAARVMSR
jgi:hypothetical protein